MPHVRKLMSIRDVLRRKPLGRPFVTRRLPRSFHFAPPKSAKETFGWKPSVWAMKHDIPKSLPGSNQAKSPALTGLLGSIRLARRI